MARQGFEPEIRTAMATGRPPKKNTSPPRESPADMARDKAKGIKEGSSQDQQLDSVPSNQAMPPQMQRPPQPMQGGTPPDLHHVAAATSIAHAILGRSGGGGSY